MSCDRWTVVNQGVVFFDFRFFPANLGISVLHSAVFSVLSFGFSRFELWLLRSGECNGGYKWQSELFFHLIVIYPFYLLISVWYEFVLYGIFRFKKLVRWLGKIKPQKGLHQRLTKKLVLIVELQKLLCGEVDLLDLRSVIWSIYLINFDRLVWFVSSYMIVFDWAWNVVLTCIIVIWIVKQWLLSIFSWKLYI